MYDVKSMINEITSKKEINNISFTGCGGSLACFFAPHYYVTHESKKLTTVYENANEFANDTPANVGENSLVVCASRRGDTRQTVAAAKKAKEVGATVVGLQLETGTPLEEICDYIIQFKDTGADGALYEESKGAYALKIAYELVNAVEHNDKKYEEMAAAMEKMNTIVPEAQLSSLSTMRRTKSFTQLVQVQPGLQHISRQSASSWKCSGSTLPQSILMNSSMDHSKLQNQTQHSCSSNLQVLQEL